MQSFHIYKPLPALAPYIRHYWTLQDEAVCPVSERTLPIGCIQVIFHRAHRLFSLTENRLQPQAFVCGQGMTFSDVLSTGAVDMITVVIQPCAAKFFFTDPLPLFFGQTISLEDLEDKGWELLSRQLTDTPDHTRCIRLLNDFLLNRLSALPFYNVNRISAVLHQINHRPQVDIARLADTACLSSKQLTRIFREHIGSSPKEFIRIVRVQRALFIMQQNPSVSFARLAYASGFADQSHMIKEFKLFSGYTPKEYASVCLPYSDYFSYP